MPASVAGSSVSKPAASTVTSTWLVYCIDSCQAPGRSDSDWRAVPGASNGIRRLQSAFSAITGEGRDELARAVADLVQDPPRSST